MAAAKERWGVFIRRGKDMENSNQGTVLSYEVILGRQGGGEKGAFTSNPRISRRLEDLDKKRKIKDGTGIGLIEYTVFPERKLVVNTYYFPLRGWVYGSPTASSATKVDLAKALELAENLKGLGLASRIELRVLKDLKKGFPGFKLIAAAKDRKFSLQSRARRLRRKQIDERGSAVDKEVPIGEEIQRIADYVGLKGMEKREGERGVKRLLAARGKARARNLARRAKPGR